MKVQNTSTQIAEMLAPDMFMIFLELFYCSGFLRYLFKRDCEPARNPTQSSPNSSTNALCLTEKANSFQKLQTSTEQINGKLLVCSEELYQHFYAEKKGNSNLCKSLRCCCNQKRERLANWRDFRRGFSNQNTCNERPVCSEEHKQANHQRCATVFDANHKPDMVTVIQCKSRYLIQAKILNNTVGLLGDGIISMSNPFAHESTFWLMSTVEGFPGTLRHMMR